jgi:hypothetical protein
MLHHIRIIRLGDAQSLTEVLWKMAVGVVVSKSQ